MTCGGGNGFIPRTRSAKVSQYIAIITMYCVYATGCPAYFCNVDLASWLAMCVCVCVVCVCVCTQSSCGQDHQITMVGLWELLHAIAYTNELDMADCPCTCSENVLLYYNTHHSFHHTHTDTHKLFLRCILLLFPLEVMFVGTTISKGFIWEETTHWSKASTRWNFIWELIVVNQLCKLSGCLQEVS